MKLEVTETTPCSRRIEIEVEPELIEERISTTVKEFRKTRTIPGFRPGKATDSVIRRWFGKDIRAQVIQNLIEETWRKALEDNDLEPVDQAQLDDIKAEPGTALQFSGTVEVKPKFDVENYKGIEVTRDIYSLTDEEVDRQIAYIRESKAKETPVDRPAQTGDVVVVDLQKLDESGLPLVGQKQDARRWLLGGMGSVSTDLDEQIAGMTAGETRTITFHYRADFYDTKRAGTEEKTSVSLKEVHERIVPEMTPEFLKELGEYATEDDLRKDVQADLTRRYESVARQQVRTQLKDRLVQTNLIEVPDALVQRLLGRMLEQHKRQGHQHEESEFREEHAAEATNEVRATLILERVAQIENISVTDEDVDGRVTQMAASMGTSVRNLRDYMTNSGRYEQLRFEMQEEAVLGFLEENAKVTEKAATNAE
jgi:trigger factor